MKEPCKVYVCTKFQVDILKNDPSFGVLKVETCHFFTHFPANSAFCDFQNFYFFGGLKSSLGSFFAFLTNN